MKKLIAAAAIAAAFLGGTAMARTATASGTRLQTVNQTETIVNSHCYTSHRVTITYYHWSKTHGWELYPSPKTTVTNSETCH